LNANHHWVVYKQPVDDQTFHLYAGNLEYFYVTYVSDVDTTDFTAWLEDRTSIQIVSEDEAIAYIVGVGQLLVNPAKTSDGRQRIAIEKSQNVRTNFFSYDFTDPCTWYQTATRIVDEVATDSGDHITYNLAQNRVIDNYHGRITQEDDLLGSGGHSLRVVVKVNDVVKTEQDPHYGTGGDYTINYELGKVIFESVKDVADVIKVTYHYAINSIYTVKPLAGKQLLIDIAEVQFSSDVDPRDTVLFEAWGIADFFLTSAQMTAYGIPYGIGYKIRLQRLAYKTMADFHNDAFRSYPSYPALGDPDNWRSQHHAVTTFDWDYLGSVSLSSAKGMELRVYLEHHEPFVGYMATATFYCRSESE
jgi:hypothetical protein